MFTISRFYNHIRLNKHKQFRVPRTKTEEVCHDEEFVDRYNREPDTFLDKIVTMDESAVAFHTPETKKQSKQWVKKGAPGPIKCKTQASRVKQMVLAFHDNKGLIYTNMVPRGTTVNADTIVGALKQFFLRG